MAADALLKEFSVYLDVKRPTSNRDFEVVEGDTANRITIFLTDDGTAVSLDGRRVLAVFSSSKGTACQDSSVSGGGVSLDGNKVTIDLFTSSFSAGMVECELQIYSGGTKGDIGEPVYFYLITSAKFNFTCRRSILNSETLPSVSQFPLLMSLILDVSTAEAARDSAESARAEAETARAGAESARVSAESARVRAESARAEAETARAGAESARVSAEAARVSAENTRAAAEAARATAENTRATAEAARVSAENTRAAAEAARAAAETQRGSILRGSVAVSELDNAIANGWYECGGGILLVESPVTGSVSERPSSSFNVHQTLISASDRTIKQRDAVFTSSSSTWLAWSELVTAPVRGVDYWTSEDIAAIKSYVDEAILGGTW